VKIRTKAVLYTTILTLFTAAVGLGGSLLRNISQADDENLIRLTTAIAVFERSFGEMPKFLDKKFEALQAQEALAIQTLKTVESGWTLEVGLSFTGEFDVYEKVLLDDGSLTYFAFYYAPKLQGPEKLALYAHKSIDGFVQVEGGDHYRRLEFGREPIANPEFFSGVYMPRYPYGLYTQDGAIVLIAEKSYGIDLGADTPRLHIGTIVLGKEVDINLDALSSELGVFITLYDMAGKAGPSGISVPDIDLDAARDTLRTVTTIRDANDNGYDSILVPLSVQEVPVGYASVSIPHSLTTQRIYEMTIVFALIALGTGTVVAFLSSLLVSRWSKSITRLGEVANDIARGNLDKEIDVTATDELGQLAESFRVMRDSLKDQMARLKDTSRALSQMNTHLEDRVEERTRELNETLEELERAKNKAEGAAEAKSTFLANMSHEIRTPMNAVMGLGRLLERTPLDGRQKDYVTKIQESSESLLNVINDILDFSKIEANKLDLEETRFDIEMVVRKVVNICSHKIYEKGLELVVDIESDVPRSLCGDPLRLQQVLTNLANNAVKFTNIGTIYIKVSLLGEADGKVRLKFSVKDTGVGMTPEQMNRLFQSFAQADGSVTRKYGGTGLGLAISKQLTHLMDGEIWAESTPGEGSEFQFTVVTRSVPKDVDPWRAELAFGHLRVLVADDADVARMVMVSLLAGLGISADSVSDGHHAVEAVIKAQEEGRPYHVILMDWHMPVLDGISAAREIQKRISGDAPNILMVSAYDKEKAKRVSAGSGIRQFIEKPVTQSDLVDGLLWMVNGGDRPDDTEERDDPWTSLDLSACRILLVEDNDVNEMVARGLLADTRATVVSASNGVAALRCLEESAFDLVLMDIQMPEMDGLTATRIIRSQMGLKDLPVIAMTAHAMEGDAKKSLAAGMNDHITKPLVPEVLYNTLAHFLAHKRSDVAGPAPDAKGAAEVSDTGGEPGDGLIERAGTLENIDAQGALANVQGNRVLYQDLLQIFAKKNLGVAETLPGLYQDGKWDELRFIAHSLKASATYIGAHLLAEAAKHLEHAASEPPAPNEVLKNAMEAVAVELATVVAHLAGILHLNASQGTGVR